MKLSLIPSISRSALVCAAACLMSGILRAGDQPSPPMETHVLSDGSAADKWYPSESSVESAKSPSKTGSSIIHWHVPVDYHAGEAKYPIGWPRMGLSLKGGMTDWSDWDYLHFWIYANTNRGQLPNTPAGLSVQQGDAKSSNFSVSLTDLKKGQWLEVSIPVSKLSHADDVRGLQFNIAESNYYHGDKIDFFIDEIALLRYAKPILLEFSAENQVIFSDAKVMATKFILSGLARDEKKKVTLSLTRDGQTIIASESEAGRGNNRLTLSLAQAKMQAGNYVLSATPEGGEAVSSQIRVIESPWH